MDIQEFKEKLRDIESMGYIPTLRKGDTGVGQTLEQHLGLTENNLCLPDIGGKIELKAFRKRTESMLTLFTKEPLSDYGRGRDRYLLNTFGYDSSEDDRILNLYTTISANNFNSQGFSLEVSEEGLFLVHAEEDLNIYWPHELLKDVFEQKLPELVVVLADTKDSDFNETFHYNEAYYLRGFSFYGFMTNILEGNIKVDLRMHMKVDDRVRNHGTAFRIVKSELYNCFDNKLRIL